MPLRIVDGHLTQQPDGAVQLETRSVAALQELARLHLEPSLWNCEDLLPGLTEGEKHVTASTPRCHWTSCKQNSARDQQVLLVMALLVAIHHHDWMHLICLFFHDARLMGCQRAYQGCWSSSSNSRVV